MLKILSDAILKIFRRIYKPLSRAYAKSGMPHNEPADKFMAFLVAIQFWETHRYWPHFRRPRSFSEKVFNRMLYDRDPKWQRLTDKFFVREDIAKKANKEYLVPLLWSGHQPDAIPYDELPSTFVIKTNHGCGFNIIIMDKTQVDKKNVSRQLSAWLKVNYCKDTSLGVAWSYKNIEPRILVEQFLNENGKPPVDYKFFCFSGRAEYLLMTFDRHGNPFEKHFTREFIPLDLWNGCRQYPGKVERPQNYEEMIALAESLAQGYDFVRVDLYNLQGRIYFGELTCYPAGGLARFIPRDYDYLFGSKWEMGH